MAGVVAPRGRWQRRAAAAPAASAVVGEVPRDAASSPSAGRGGRAAVADGDGFWKAPGVAATSASAGYAGRKADDGDDDDGFWEDTRFSTGPCPPSPSAPSKLASPPVEVAPRQSVAAAAGTSSHSAPHVDPAAVATTHEVAPRQAVAAAAGPPGRSVSDVDPAAAAAAREVAPRQAVAAAAGAASGSVLDMDPAAVAAAREAEASALEAIYDTEFEALGPGEWLIDLQSPPGAPEAALRVLLPEGYPLSEAPPVPIVDCTGGGPGFEAAASAAVQELLAQWQPSEQGCVYQWVEHLRDAVRPLLDEMASSFAAAVAMQEDEAQAAELDAQAMAGLGHDARGFTYLPANPQYGQRQRHFDAASFDASFAVDIQHGEPFTDRKSTFQGHAVRVTNEGQVKWALRDLLSDRKVAVATHNIFAYRYFDEARGVQVADNDDDGEDGAGSKLAHLLSLSGCEGVLVMVSRWYGGIQLGSDRFKHINRAASTLLDSLGWSNRGRTGAAGGRPDARGGGGGGRPAKK